MQATRKRSLGLVFLAVVLIAAGNSATPAQEMANEIYVSPSGAQKFDEFGVIGGCDSSARLDNFAVLLQSDPTIRGNIIVYGPQGAGSGTAAQILDSVKGYLVTSRAIDHDRILTINGGRLARGQVRVELWVLAAGVSAPEPTPASEAATNFAGKLGQYQTYDELVLLAEGGTGGISFGNVTLATFADTLRQQPASRAYIVAYADRNAALGAAARVARREAARILRHYGLEANRVSVINGGRRATTRIELWILPADAPPPVAEASAEEHLTEAVRIGSFERFVLGDEHSATWARDNLVEVLRHDQQTQAFIIVRLPQEDSDAEESAETEGNGGTETNIETEEGVETSAEPNDSSVPSQPELDLLQLAERWKTELAERNGIEPHRITVVVGRSREGETLETWIVPPGALPPDPQALPADEAEDEAADETEEEGEPEEPRNETLPEDASKPPA